MEEDEVEPDMDEDYDEEDDDVIQEDVKNEVSNSRSEECKQNSSDPKGSSSANEANGSHEIQQSSMMMPPSVQDDFKSKSKYQMGLEEEKIDGRAQKASKDQQVPKHRLLFGVPVIIEENSSSNQCSQQKQQSGGQKNSSPRRVSVNNDKINEVKAESGDEISSDNKFSSG